MKAYQIKYVNRKKTELIVRQILESYIYYLPVGNHLVAVFRKSNYFAGAIYTQSSNSWAMLMLPCMCISIQFNSKMFYCHKIYSIINAQF